MVRLEYALTRSFVKVCDRGRVTWPNENIEAQDQGKETPYLGACGLGIGRLMLAI